MGDYIGDMPENFNPDGSYGFNASNPEDSYWDFGAKELGADIGVLDDCEDLLGTSKLRRGKLR
jgi:hypothetical protein